MKNTILSILVGASAWSIAQAQESELVANPDPTATLATLSEDGPISVAPEVAAPERDFFDKDSYKIRTVICPFKGEIDYEPGDITCGALEVPENREKSRPRTIELFFTKLHAKKPDDWDEEEKGEWIKRDDPVIYLTGGPGAQAQGYVERFQSHGVRTHRDLYVLEQRGIGWSDDFCLDFGLIDPAAGNSPNWEDYQRAGIAAVEKCFAGAKAARVDLSGYNTIENARDVKALRIALGYDDWNVWGISYGSILGQAYIKEDEDGIRAAVIDAIVPLQQDLSFHNIARHYDRTLSILEEACSENETCAGNFPDFKSRLEKAITKTSMSPIEVDAIDTEFFPSGKAWFFQDVLGGAPFTLFYEQDNYATLPAFIDAYVRLFENADAQTLRILTAGGAPGAFGGFSQGMYNAIACNDNWYVAMRKSYEQDHIDFPALAMIFGDPSLLDEQAALCKRYGMPPRPAEDYLATQTDIRTLIVEGAMDPITPPPLAELILPGFTNGTYVEFAFAGHGPTRSVECSGEFLTAFYDDPDGELDLSCPQSMEAPDFVGRLFESNVLAMLGAKAAEDPKKVAMPGLWIASSALILIIGALIYTIAPVARLINGEQGMGTGGARLTAWLTSLLGAAAIGGIGAGAYSTYEANEFLLLVGFLDWTRWFAIAGVAAGATGLLLVWQTIRARLGQPLQIGVLLGLLLTGLAGIMLAAFLIIYGPRPF